MCCRHPEVKANLDRMVLQRGPLVYCTEWPDVPDSLVLNLVVDKDVEITATHEPGLLNGVTVLGFLAKGTRRIPDGEIETYPKYVKAIPYYGWAHRGRGEMAVWMATENETATPLPAPSLSGRSNIRATHPPAALQTINE